MANLAKKKTLGAGFANEKELVRVEWDFAVDGGAAAVYDALEADGVMAARMIGAYVITAATSGGSMTIDFGKNGGAEFLSSTAVASLTLGAYLVPASQDFVLLADGDSLDLEIKVAAATAGKIVFIMETLKIS